MHLMSTSTDSQSTVTLRDLTKAQRDALKDAGKRGHVFSHVPGSRYSGFWEPGKHHHRVVRRLVELGLLTEDTYSDPANRITDAGRALLEPTAK